MGPFKGVLKKGPEVRGSSVSAPGPKAPQGRPLVDTCRVWGERFRV